MDQIEQRQTRGLILLGDRHHEAKVRLHERPFGILALACGATQLALLGSCQLFADLIELVDRGLPGLDLFGKPNFIVFGEQHVLTDISQVQANQVFFVALYAIFRHELLLER